MSDKVIKALTAIGILGAVALIVVGCIYEARQVDRFESNCRAKGGRVDTTTSVDVHVDAKGKPYTTTHTTYYCFVNGQLAGIYG